MAGIELQSGMKSGWVEAQVTRADGTVENLGVVAYNHKNPFKVAAWEKETFGQVTQGTAVRCAKASAPYVAAGVAALSGIGYWLLRK